jgi:hypothetical protein
MEKLEGCMNFGLTWIEELDAACEKLDVDATKSTGFTTTAITMSTAHARELIDAYKERASAIQQRNKSYEWLSDKEMKMGAEIKKLRDLLRRYQAAPRFYHACVECGWNDKHPCAPDCELAEALK